MPSMPSDCDCCEVVTNCVFNASRCDVKILSRRGHAGTNVL